MQIHYGLGKANPVARMRFFPKFANSECVGHEVSEQTYATLLPRHFEDKRIRVFCRSQEKVRSARKAFEIWCRRKETQFPFPSAATNDVENGTTEFGYDYDADEKGWTQFSQEE